MIIKLKNKEWGILIGVVIVIALVVSLVTVNLTGNVIKVRSTLVGQKVYTKAEVDTKLNGVATNQGVLDRLSKCEPITIHDTSLGTTTKTSFSCDEICSNLQVAKKCIGGFVQGSRKNINGHDITYLWRPITSCSENILISASEDQMQEPLCTCCSP